MCPEGRELPGWVLDPAFSLPGDWDVPAPTELSGDAGDQRHVDFELQIGQYPPVGLFAVACQDVRNPDNMQISDVFAVERDLDGYVTAYPDVSEINLRRAAGWDPPEKSA